jgi:hypothetical protein
MRIFNSKFSIASMLAVALVAAASTVHAALIAPGASFATPPTASPAGGAAIIASTGPVNFVSTPDPTAFHGILRSDVYTNDAANPFGINKLTFVFQLSNDGTSLDVIERLTNTNFAGYQTDVGWNGAGVIPSQVDRSANSRVIGWGLTTVSWLAPGQASATLVIATDATQFTTAFSSVIDGGTANIPTFGPAPIPEPATMGILGISGASLLAIRRRGR